VCSHVVLPSKPWPRGLPEALIIALAYGR
jgi:hypothetical protein